MKRPRKHRAATPARRSARRSKRGTSTAGTALQCVKLGTPLSITYRHAHGGTYRHTFKGGRLLYTRDGKHLLIDGPSVKAFIE